MSVQPRRIAIVTIHGVGDHEPQAHEYSAALGLSRTLASATGKSWEIGREYIRVEPGTRVRDLPSSFLRVATTKVSPEEKSVLIDLHGVSWSHFTRGYESTRKLLGAIAGALDTVQTAWRRESGKTIAEQILLGVYALIACAVLLSGPIATFIATSYLAASWYDFLVLLPLMFISGNLLRAATGRLLNVRGSARLFKADMTLNSDVLLPLRLLSAYLRSQAFSRGLSSISLLQGMATLFVAMFPVAVIVAYENGHRSTFANFRPDWLFLLSAIVLSFTAPTVSLFGRAFKYALRPLEDIYTFCSFSSTASPYERKSEVINRATETLIDALNLSLSPDGVPYDEVYVFGHSMGSYIGLRAIVRLREAVAQGVITEEQFSRVKGFVTYGSAVEKITAHFGLERLNERPAEAMVISDSMATFGPSGIPWLNVYYMTDIVADPISLFFRASKNVSLPFPWKLWSHSFYHEDGRFWELVARESLNMTMRKRDTKCSEHVTQVLKSWWGRADIEPIFNSTQTSVGGLIRVGAVLILLLILARGTVYVRSLAGFATMACVVLVILTLLALTVPEKEADGKG